MGSSSRAEAPAGLARWLPGLATLRELPTVLAAPRHRGRLVLTTMLVPVGIAYAVASGLPGIYGLYATIVPLLAYALFGPSRILVLGPDSSLAAVILAVVLPLSASAIRSAPSPSPAPWPSCRASICILAGVLQPRLRHRTAVQADPLRLHERHRADRADQPAAQAVRLLDRGRRAVAQPVGDRRGDLGRQDELDGASRSAPARWRSSCC